MGLENSSVDSHKMLASERRAAFGLACLYVVRMLGLFLILPVFALYAEHLQGATPLLTGLAIGIYGLSQAVMQIPLGTLSDRIGRKRVIIFGLLLLAGGSVIAALADSIFWVIIGRALQGAGAIAAAVMALAADLSREEQRTKVMAIIGISIGLSFAASLVLGPVLDVWVGVDGIFWLTAVLALVAILLTQYVIPQPVVSRRHRDTTAVPALFKQVLRDKELLRLDGGIFILHMLLTAIFVALPLVLRDSIGISAENHWRFYLLALGCAILLLVPLIAFSERKRMIKPTFVIAIVALGLSVLGFQQSVASYSLVLCCLIVFFVAFNFLEATLPSLITRIAPAGAKGTALGVYSSAQFLGTFIGGVVAGALHSRFGLDSVFIFGTLGTLVWLLLAVNMAKPRYLSSYLLNIGTTSEAEAERLAQRLLQVTGVAEAVVIAAEGIAYLKVDKRTLDISALQGFSV